MSEKIILKITSIVILCTLLTYTVPVFAFTKDETVYSKINSNGENYSTIVSDHIKNEEQRDFINDISDLLNIKNVNGDEEFTQNGNELVWSINGKDVYYQGESQKELPLECKLKYELDGKELTAQEIVGKSGKVKITIEYINKDEHVVNINGKNEKLYTPFVVVCGTILDNDNNKNIEITNGKLMDNGDKTVVIGMSLPGMQESMNISKDKLDIPSTVEITMDTTDFELNNIVTYITPKLLEDTDVKLFDNIDKIYNIANELKSASTQLVNGSERLKDGMKELKVGTNELSVSLNAKISEYEEARKKLLNKKEIEKKIIETVNNEIKKLAPELEKLASKEASNVIKENKEEIEQKTAETALKYTKTAIQNKLQEFKNNNATINIPSELLEQIENDVKKALSNLLKDKEVQELERVIKDAIINDVKTTVKAKTSSTIKNEVNKYKNVDLTQLLSNADLAKLGAFQQTMIKGLMAQYPTLTIEQASAKAQESINELAKTVMNKTLDTVEARAPIMAENTVDEVVKSLNTDEAIAKAISNFKDRIVKEITAKIGKETLASMEKNIKNKIIEEVGKTFKEDKYLQQQISNTYGAKAKAELNLAIDNIAEKTANDLAGQLSEKLANQIANNLIKKQLKGELSETQLDKELSKYENSINSKLNEVDSQINLLKDALVQLNNGTDELSKGATTLSEGMTTFDKEGIEKIYNYINGDLSDITARLEKLQELSKEYNNFTMLNDENKGNVKFILIMDSIKKSEENKQETIIEDDKQKNK